MYRELHQEAEEFLVRKLKRMGHEVEREVRQDSFCIFDVYDKTTDTAWEILTAKIIKPSHEHEEGILTKLFRYLLYCRDLRFLVVGLWDEDLPALHRLKLRHWHLRDKRLVYHPGLPARRIAERVLKAMLEIAPIEEWTREGRRKDHPKKAVEERFRELTQKLGLPKNFLLGLWRDWRLNWVWKLEEVLPRWSTPSSARSPSRKGSGR